MPKPRKKPSQPKQGDWLADRLRADADVAGRQMTTIDKQAALDKIFKALDDIDAKKTQGKHPHG